MDQDCRKTKDLTRTAPIERTPKRPRRSAEETRGEILDTAEELFRTYGFASVSIADIATDLSMSPANVFKHFRTKTSLVDAIAARAIEQKVHELAQLDRTPSPRERILALATHLMMDHLNGRKDAPFVFEMILVTIKEELDCGERFRHMIVDMLAQIIRDGAADGTYHVDDVDKFANAAFDALVCVIHPVMIGLEKPDILATRCNQVVGLIDAALRSPLAK